jgi:RNA polymerase sigma factor (sigma-70 family)
MLNRARAGDERALSTLLQACAGCVRARFAEAIPGRWADQINMDDLLQQTYLDAFLSIRRFSESTRDAFVAWLCTIAKRNLLDAVRALEADKRGGSRRTVSLDAADDRLEPLLDQVTAVSLTPSRFAARNEAVARLREAVAALPAPHRDVVVFYDLDGQSMPDVAARIGRTVGTAYMLRARALGWLAEMLGGTSVSFRPAI